MKNRHPPVVAGLVIVAFTLWLQITDTPWINSLEERLEYLFFDMRMRLTLEESEPDRRIVIVDIDEKSLRELGHWPWPRDTLARMVDRLYDLGSVVVGFDMVFPELERNQAVELLKRIEQLKMDAGEAQDFLERHAGRFDNNRIFADSLAGRDVVLGYAIHFDDKPSTGLLPEPVRLEGGPADAELGLPVARGYTGNSAVLQSAARHGGFFSLKPDRDGVLRRVPVLVRVGELYYPLLAVEILRQFLLLDAVEVVVSQGFDYEAIEAIKLGQLRIPTDGLGRAVIPFRGRSGSFPYVSASDVLQGRADANLFDGAIVLIGTTAEGLYDLRPTPVQAVYPGVEVHANLIAAALDDRFPLKPDWADGVNFSLLLLLGLFAALQLPRMQPFAMLMSGLLLTLLLFAGNFGLWLSKGFILELAIPLLMVMLLVLFNVSYGFTAANRSRNRIKELFGHYVPPEIVRQMTEREEEGGFGLEGESREMSVLFSDIRDFTSISETLSASELKVFLNRAFTPLTRTIFESKGTIDKYVGDMVMAFWGAPVPDALHARHAIEAGFAMIEDARRLRAEFRREGLPEIHIGIGINSGTMNVGDMGSEYRRAYTVLGDAVNLASRLEGLTRYYGVDMIVGEETYRLAKEHFLFRRLDRVRVKGKQQAVDIYQPLCPLRTADPVIREATARHDQAFELCMSRRWQDAMAIYTELQARNDADRRLYRVYLERIESYIHNPPAADWDGVFDRRRK